jgi:hypothetical protein
VKLLSKLLARLPPARSPEDERAGAEAAAERRDARLDAFVPPNERGFKL